MRKIFLCLGLIGGVLSTSSIAGFSEGEDAFNAQQYRAAFSEFLPLADAGDFRSQYYIGYLYLNGYGIAKDNKKALNYLERAVDQEYDLAQSLMAFLYSEGKVVPKNKKKALNLYEQAAEQGNISALLNLGIMYYTGDGVEKNTTKALEYFNKIPVLQKPIVGRYLGEIYLNESGFVNHDLALSYYKQSAAANDIGSYYALALMNQKGQGTEKNVQDAIKYYQYAASQNHAPSQYMLGAIYANGDGVPRDKLTAYAWFSLAADQHLGIAEKAQDTLQKDMSLSELEKARRQMIDIQQNVIGKIQPPLTSASVPVVSTQETVQTIRKSVRRRRR